MHCSIFFICPFPFTVPPWPLCPSLQTSKGSWSPFFLGIQQALLYHFNQPLLEWGSWEVPFHGRIREFSPIHKGHLSLASAVSPLCVCTFPCSVPQSFNPVWVQLLLSLHLLICVFCCCVLWNHVWIEFSYVMKNWLLTIMQFHLKFLSFYVSCAKKEKWLLSFLIFLKSGDHFDTFFDKL